MQLGYTIFVAFCVSGLVGTKIIITSKNSCLKENRSLQEISTVTTPVINPEKVYLPPLNVQPGLLKNFFKAVY
jgi:hypothetical protein